MRRALVLGSLLALAAASAAHAKTTLPGFVSPSHNIRCFRNAEPPATLHCSIAKADYARRLTAYCGADPIGVDWAGFELGATRKGGVACSGGVLYEPSAQRLDGTVLPYGKIWRSGVFTCSSRVAGITCTSRTGHGLFVSRQTWRAW
jgi:hypothetical protein